MYGDFVWARRALNHPKRRFPARADETTGLGQKTTPCFATVVGIQRIGWAWRHSFIGQADCAKVPKNDDGGHFFRVVKSIFTEASVEIWKRLVFASTDGASAIRSTNHYRGVMARGSFGKSLFGEFS